MDSTRKAPNIILILADQQRWDTVGAYGRMSGLTPNLDALAERGVVFDTAITCQPVCGPARACIQTGLYASENGVHLNGLGLKGSGLPTLATTMQDAGYRTGYVGKWHLSGDRSYYTKPIPKESRAGYDEIWRAADLPEYCSNPYHSVLWDENEVRLDDGDGVYRTSAYGNHTLQVLRKLATGDPFFLTASFVEPHPQPVHKGYTGPVYQPQVPILREYLVYDGPPEYRPQASLVPLPGDLAGMSGDHEKGWVDYLASCTAVDVEVGKILGELRRLDIEEDTVVIYTSDHGNHFRTRNVNDGKCSCHDASLRVPLIASGPGFAAGHRCMTPASILDVPYSIYQAADINPPYPHRGVPLQQQQNQDRDRAVFAQTSRFELSRCLRTRRYKYAVTADDDADFTLPTASMYREALLFDLETDPHEQYNLIGNAGYRDVANELRNKLRIWLDSIGESACEIRLFS